jgi:integrase/recombinase XerD
MPRAVPHDIGQGAMPLVVEEFLSWMLTERGRAANTLAAYRRDLERYCSWLQPQSLDLATVAMGDLDRFVGERRQVASPATVARELAAIRMLHRFLADEGIRADDPTADIQGVRVPAGLPKP